MLAGRVHPSRGPILLSRHSIALHADVFHEHPGSSRFRCVCKPARASNLSAGAKKGIQRIYEHHRQYHFEARTAFGMGAVLNNRFSNGIRCGTFLRDVAHRLSTPDGIATQLRGV